MGRYRMVSRVICWDRKWLYMATQFRSVGGNEKAKEGVIFATALARYVVKAGRLTVPPEKLLDAAELLGAKGTSARKEAQQRSERALRYVQGFAAMDELRGEFDEAMQPL
jgi:hypothetical protein